jgi:L-rhamnose mutarotase
MSCRFCEKMTMPSATLIRKAFVMTLHAGAEEEYERRHRPIWAELEAVLKAHGAHRYSIFLDSSTRQLFGYVEIEDEARWNAIARTDVCQRSGGLICPILCPAIPTTAPSLETFTRSSTSTEPCGR